MEFFIVKKK